MITWDISSTYLKIKNFKKIFDLKEKSKNEKFKFPSQIRNQGNGSDEALNQREEEKEGREGRLGVLLFEVEKRRKKQLEIEEEEKQFMSIIEFSRDGIKEKKLDCKHGRFYNFYFFVRLLAFEPIFISLQMLPILQISIIIVIQFWFAYFTLKAIYSQKIFSNCLIALNYGVNEVFLTLFSLFCFFLAIGGEGIMKFENFVKVQKTTVIVIIVIGAFNMLIFVVSLIGVVRLMLLKGKSGNKVVAKESLSMPFNPQNIAEEARKRRFTRSTAPETGYNPSFFRSIGRQEESIQEENKGESEFQEGLPEVNIPIN